MLPETDSRTQRGFYRLTLRQKTTGGIACPTSAVHSPPVAPLPAMSSSSGTSGAIPSAPPSLACYACLHELAFATTMALVHCPACSTIMTLCEAHPLPPNDFGLTRCSGCRHLIMAFPYGNETAPCRTCGNISPSPPPRYYACHQCKVHFVAAATEPITVCKACRAVYPPPTPRNQVLCPLPPVDLSPVAAALAGERIAAAACGGRDVLDPFAFNRPLPPPPPPSPSSAAAEEP